MPEATIDNSPKFDRRPWGIFTVLDEGENHKVKRIEVLPGKRLSYQKHAQRAEHWFVAQGTAKVTLDDREIARLGGVEDFQPELAGRNWKPVEGNGNQ